MCCKAVERALVITIDFLRTTNVIVAVKFGVKRDLLALLPLILALYPKASAPNSISTCHVSVSC